MKRTKTKLVSSIVTLLVCFAMLVGSTFAWFTDSASTGVNKIQAGNLDVELYHSNNGSVSETSTNKVDESTKLFNVNLWEPGMTVYENLLIKNAGNLAFKYQLGISQLLENKNFNYLVEAGNTAENHTGRTLMDVLYVYECDENLDLNVARNLTANNGILLKTYLNAGLMKTGQLKAGESKKLSLVIYWPESEIDNNYNVNNGRSTTPLLDENGSVISGTEDKLTINFPITVYATQYTYESDSFDNQYDKNAGIDAVWGGITTTDTSINVDTNSPLNTLTISEGNETLVEVQVPTTELASGTTKLNLTVTRAETEIANPVVTVSAGNNSQTFDVELVDQYGNKVSTSNNPMKVTLNIGVVDLQKFYHKGNLLSKVNTIDEVQRVGQYFYDTETGKVTYKTDSFSPFTAVYKFEGGNGSEQYPYVITDSKNLKNLAALVNEGNNYSEKYFILANDINLNNEEWTPIGQKAGNKFAGVFDGNNKTISGLSITENNIAATDTSFDKYVGLFGAIENGTVKNLTVSGSVKGKNAAGIVARMESGTIENCISNVTVVGTDNGKAGGIVCFTHTGDCTIKNCINNGSVKGVTIAGVGGIAAYVREKTTISGCKNNAEIGSNTDKYSGGIVGYLTAGENANIKECNNTGNIVAYEQAGGIVGISTNISFIENCNNSGTITAGENGNAGGIAGTTAKSIVKNCSNSASVHGKFAGGVIGEDAQSTIENCSGGTSSITSPAYTLGFNKHPFTLDVLENGTSGRILGAHKGAGQDKYTILILDDNNGDDNTIPTVGICGNYTTMPLLKIQSGTFHGEPLAGNRSSIILENEAAWNERIAGTYCRGGVDGYRIEAWTLQG